MKKLSNMMKLTACIVACSMLLIGNPLKADAGRWDCFWGNHKIVSVYIPATCTSFPAIEARCADCGKFYWREAVYTSYAPHCYSTNPYQVPTCLVCGYKKR